MTGANWALFRPFLPTNPSMVPRIGEEANTKASQITWKKMKKKPYPPAEAKQNPGPRPIHWTQTETR